MHILAPHTVLLCMTFLNKHETKQSVYPKSDIKAIVSTDSALEELHIALLSIIQFCALIL